MTKVAPRSHDRAPIPEGYSIAPHKVTRDGSLSRDARLLWVILDGRQGSAGSTRVRIATLAEDLDADPRSVRRWLDELRAADLVTTRQTGRSLVFVVHNGTRRADTDSRPSGSRVDTDVLSDRTQMSSPQRSNPREVINNNTQRTDPIPAPSASGVDEYLESVRQATGVRLRSTGKVREHLAEIRSQGLSATDLAVLVAAYAATQRDLHNPGGFIHWTLEDLAAGNRPEQMALPIHQTPPPTYAEQMSGDPCEHGDPRGSERCALCRHQIVTAQ